jgi:UDP-hydrolysing UDP-N-acetyl-D-glucosamine 2-epimerase
MSSARWSVGVATTSRADFGIYRSVLKALAAESELDVGLYVSGMHLAPEFGDTVLEVEASPWPILARVPCLTGADTPAATAASMGRGTIGFAEAFEASRPDILVVLGDRYEMTAAALAALPFVIPVAHLHGGEETEGAIDNALRHVITKLAHLHFPATERAAARIRAMGEPPARVIRAGAPALDHMAEVELFDHATLATHFGFPAEPFILTTFHPETLSIDRTLAHFDAVMAAALADGHPIVVTLANADAAGRAINARLRDIAAAQPAVTLIENMGTQLYYSAMKAARLMLGNSSSGILEAASFGLPVVNVGDRQKGRERSGNIIDVPAELDALTRALQEADSPTFRARATDCVNVYGDGHAAPRIAAGLLAFLKEGADVRKPFFESLT